MAIPSLLGSYIDQTYPRLVQTSGSEFADGLGNPISIGISGGTDTYIPLWSGSNALTSSFLNQSGSVLKTTSASIDKGLSLDFANQKYTLGDYINSNNQFKLIVDDANSLISTTDNFGTNGLQIGAGYTNIGFFTGTYAYLGINGGNGTIQTFDTPSTSNGLSLDFNNNIYKIGSFNGNNTQIVINDISSSIALSGSVLISGSATLNGVTLEPASVDNINISSSNYNITSWGVYRVTVGDNTLNYNLNLPDPTLFPGYEISIINSDRSSNVCQFGTNPPYRLSGTSTWDNIEPNIMMILKSIGGKWIGPKIPES